MQEINYEKILFYLWFANIKGLGSVLCRRLLKYYETPQTIYNLGISELMKVDGIGEKLAESIYRSKDFSKAKSILDECIKKEISISILDDSMFPEILNNYLDSPILLFYKGNLYKEFKGVGIVGSRRCTEYGKNIAIESAKYLSKQGIPVVSGMAKGIDSYAQTACIKEGGFTAAVLGFGLDICYPKEHIELMKKIIEKGLIISEYPPSTAPDKRNFPKRNKLISYLCEKILVAEAGEKSGALITANFAKKQNKVVLSAPNNKYISSSIGTNKLIQDGAEIYIEPTQLHIKNIYEEKRIKPEANKGGSIIYNNLEKDIISLLENKTLTIDDILKYINIEKQQLIDLLLNLELNDAIKMKSGGKYSSF